MAWGSLCKFLGKEVSEDAIPRVEEIGGMRSAKQ